MTKLRTATVLSFLVLALCVSAQGESLVKESWFTPRFNVRVGLGGALMEHEKPGFAASVGGSVEMPMSKKYDGWKVNIGMRLFNVNPKVDGGIFYYGSDEKDLSWSYDVRELLLEVPVVFSYDFHVAKQGDLRLGFGVFYSRYITGDTKLSATGEKFAAHGGILSAENGVYDHDSFVQNFYNGGLIVELGYYFKDFYFGAEYKMAYGAWIADHFGRSLNATFGYRF